MMTKSDYFVFLQFLRGGLWEKNMDSDFVCPLDIADVYRIAQQQSVVGLFAAGLERLTERNVPKSISLAIAGEVLQYEHRNKSMNVFIGSLFDKLQAEGIFTILIKGQGIAQCYERPLWRSSGDVDLFLSENDYLKAKVLLLPLASSVEEEFVREKHLGMTINGWVVELHGHLYSGLSSKVEKELDVLQKETFGDEQLRSWMNGKTQVFMLKAENDAFYVFTHILQHFYKGGIGLRQICDWCRLLYTYRDSLDYDLLEKRIKLAGLMTEWKAFAALAVEYLGMAKETMPFYSDSSKWKRKAKRILNFVMMSGNFGHNRDMSYYSKYPYIIRKCISMSQRVGDLIRHSRIFPLDSLRFFPTVMFNGVKSAMRGEG